MSLQRLGMVLLLKLIPWPKLLKVVICSNDQIKSHKIKSNQMTFPNQIFRTQIKSSQVIQS